jgi:hypothetical protein
MATKDDQGRASQIAAAEAAALMDSMLRSFKAACEQSSSSALTTIEADMDKLVLANRKAVSCLIATMHADLNLMRRLTRFGPWVIVTCLILLIAGSFGASWWWAQSMISGARASALQDAGIATYPTPTGAILVPNPNRLTLTTCRLQGQSATAPCLIPLQQPGR